METLIRFFIIFRTFIVFVLLEVLSLVLVFSYNDYQHVAYLNTSNTVVGHLYAAVSSVTGYFSLSSTNQNLAKENSKLKYELTTARNIIEYYKEDSTYHRRLEAAQASNYTFITGRVIGASFTKSHNYLTLDKGSADGVQRDMGVISNSGVVGIVSSVSPHFALVIPVLNEASRISVKVINKSQTGTLVWKGSDYSAANIEDVPPYIPVAKGDTVVTNGFSSIFPEGIAVGKVQSVSRGQDNNLSIKVKLGPDFTKLTYVDIIMYKNMTEKRELEKEATGNE